MSVKSVTAIAALLLTGCAPTIFPSDTVAQQESRNQLASQCEGKDGWSDPAPPAHVFGNVYMVGTCGIVSLLITSPEGHILIDGATEEAAPGIAANIGKLGFDPEEVKYLLNSHEHIDHAGGLAELKNLTGAKLVARAPGKAALESGKPDTSDPQHDHLLPFPGAKVDRVIADGESITVGRLKLTAIASPGHTLGGTSWTWKSCEGKICHDIVYADSLSAVSADGYRFSDHSDYVATFKKTLDRIGKLKNCDILITPHPGQSDFFERLSGKEPLVSATDCRDYASGALDRLNKRLAEETTK